MLLWDPCEHDKTSGFIQGGKFLDQLNYYQLIMKPTNFLRESYVCGVGGNELFGKVVLRPLLDQTEHFCCH
jgi:hypothetical protein